MWFVLGLAHASGAYDVLRARDEVSCETLGAATPALRAELMQLTGETGPPWMATRAVACLVERFGQEPGFAAEVLPWFSDPERIALAYILVVRIDGIAEAGEVARAALTVEDARWKSRMRAKLAASARADVRAVVDAAEAGG